MQKLMILGAGIYQVPLIKQARQMGIYTVVVSISGDYPGFDYADRIYYEDTRNDQSILRIAQKERIDGIVTSGTDVAVRTIGTVCDAMGLTGLSFRAAQIATDKMLMKERYQAYGVRTARFQKICFQDFQADKDLAGMRLPLVFKAVDTSGSRGIVRADTAADFADSVHMVQKHTKKDYFIVEEFLEGEEFGAQAFISHGKIQFILPHGDYVYYGNTGVPVGHWMPYALDETQLADMEEQLQKAAAAMQLDHCAMNVDFIMSKGLVYVLEIGGRAGATCLPEMVSLYYGYNYYEKIIQAALGQEPDFTSHENNPNAAMLLRSGTDGRVREIRNQNQPSDPDIVDLQFDVQVGGMVSAFRVGPDRIGHVIVKGNTCAEAKRKAEEAAGRVEVVTE